MNHPKSIAIVLLFCVDPGIEHLFRDGLIRVEMRPVSRLLKDVAEEHLPCGLLETVKGRYAKDEISREKLEEIKRELLT